MISGSMQFVSDGEMSEAKKYVRDFVGLNDEEFNKFSNEDLLKLVQVKLKSKMEDNPNEMKTLFYPDKVLREKSEPVSDFSDLLKTFARHLLIHCRRHGGLAMAAPQVGLCYRIIVVDTDLLDHAYRTSYNKLNYPQQMFNPEIINPTGKIRYKEGCLSCPGAYAWVNRYDAFTLKYQTPEGEPKTIDIKCSIGDPFGIVVQHEVDHLNGVLFIDNLDFIEKNKVIKGMNKFREKK
jgi:peptide deformylase